MSNNIKYFAINADDLSRAQEFYSKVFGWSFDAWGPPDFYQIRTGDGESGIGGALQKRRELLPGQPVLGFECTVGVEDVDEIAKAVVSSGGEIVMEKTTIAGVGDLIFFKDTEGNVAGAMRYDASAE